MSLDMELEMDELRHGRNSSQHSNHPTAESTVRMVDNNSNNGNEMNRVWVSKELKVSFQNPESKMFDIEPAGVGKNKYVKSKDDDDFDEISLHQDQYKPRTSFVDNNGGGEVLKCTSFQRRGSIMRTKTMQSRLLDPMEPPERKPGKVGRNSDQLKSGLMARASGMLPKLETTDEEDDPLFDDEDIPDNLKKAKFDALTIIQWISLVLIVSALACTLAISKLKRQRLRGLQL